MTKLHVIIKCEQEKIIIFKLSQYIVLICMSANEDLKDCRLLESLKGKGRSFHMFNKSDVLQQ